MKYNAHSGHRDFVLCVGRQADAIERHFGGGALRADGWEVRFVNAPVDASIGERFSAVRHHLLGF